MRNRKVKCRFCEIQEIYPQTEMFVEWVGKNGKTPRYWHKDCYDKELERREKTKLETEEWDNLYQTILDIHGVDVLPRNLITTLQDLRNGTDRYRENRKFQYKKGVKYSVIKKAYEMSRKKIQWIKNNKKFKNVHGEMKYCFAVVREKLGDAKRELKRIDKVNEMYSNHEFFENMESIKKFPKS